MRSPFNRSALAGSVIALGAAFALLGTAQASILYTVNTGTNGNANQSALATFDFSSPGTFSLTLNNTGTVVGIASVLDGFNFSQSGLSSFSLSSIDSAEGLVTCTSSSAKTGSCTEANGGMQPLSEWGVSSTGTSVFMSAGQGLHPYGIINDSANAWVASNGQKGGVTNAEHNPYLEGPVTFTFNVGADSTVPTLWNVQFLFGTEPTTIDGTCASSNECSPPVATPEPGALAIFGAGLLGCALFIHRRRRAARQS